MGPGQCFRSKERSRLHRRFVDGSRPRHQYLLHPRRNPRPLRPRRARTEDRFDGVAGRRGNAHPHPARPCVRASSRRVISSRCCKDIPSRWNARKARKKLVQIPSPRNASTAWSNWSRHHGIDAFVEERCVFPNGAHDDQVDAASAAFRALIVSVHFLHVDQAAAFNWAQFHGKSSSRRLLG